MKQSVWFLYPYSSVVDSVLILQNGKPSRRRKWRLRAKYHVIDLARTGIVSVAGVCCLEKYHNFTMDVAEQAVKSNQVKDQVGERCLKLFQDFLEEWVRVLWLMIVACFRVQPQNCDVHKSCTLPLWKFGQPIIFTSRSQNESNTYIYHIRLDLAAI